MAEANHIVAFRKLIATTVDDFVNASREFGEPLTAMSCLVKNAFEKQLEFIVFATAQPNVASFNMEPLSTIIQEIQKLRDRNRHVEEFFNHLSTISESIVALSWISVKPAPAPFIRDMKDAGEYFGNRVLAANRGNQKHANWISKWNDVLRHLEQYVRQFHLTGFDCGAGRGTGAPPPPPPPAPSGFAIENNAGGDDRTALLSQLNQGIGITSMLRSVKRTEATSTSPVAAQPAAGRGQQAATAVRTYPPKFLLDGKKWRVEHQKDNYGLVIEDADMSQVVAMFKCENSGLEVKNKMNGVTLDNCKRTSVVLSDIISSVEAIRCDRLKIQCNGHVPLISVDNCDSVQIFVTGKSQDVEIISSKSTSCNVCLLAPDGDYVELAMPEQIKTVIKDGNLKSSVVEKV